MAVRFRADNMVTGLTANILALGLTSYLLRVLAGGGQPVAIHLTPLAAWPIPGLAESRCSARSCSSQPPLTYLAVLGCLALALFLSRTQAGLTLRATGENPEAVFAAGGNPMRVRMLAVIACGAIAGLGGAVLSLQQVGTFTDGMTGGRGYLALASLIVGRWNPWAAAAACLVFGAAEAFELRLQSFGVPVSSYIVQMAPYLHRACRAGRARPVLETAGRDRPAAAKRLTGRRRKTETSPNSRPACAAARLTAEALLDR